jgi:hypothetical protein
VTAWGACAGGAQVLLLFLTLETESLAEHALWKDAVAAQPELRSFQLAPPLADVPVAKAGSGSASARASSKSSALGMLSSSIMGGVRQLGHRVRTLPAAGRALLGGTAASL